MARKAGSPAACKAKGRRAAKLVQELILLNAPSLTEDDVRVTPSGVMGEDIQLSSAARLLFPFAIEVKCKEKMDIWASLRQAESHAVGDLSKIPVLFFKRNNTELYVCLRARHLFARISRQHEREPNPLSS